MQKRLSLRKNFSWVFVGNVVSAACQWGILTTFVRLGRPEMVGKFALGLAIATPITVIAMLQLSAVQVTDAKNEYAFGNYFGTRLLMSFLGILVIIAIAWLGDYPKETACVIFLAGLFKSISALSDIFRGLFRHHERMDLSAISLMIKNISALAIVFVVMTVSGQIVPALVGIAIAYMLVFLVYDISRAIKLFSFKVGPSKARSSILPSFEVRTILKLVRLALPLGIVVFLISLQDSVPKYILEAYRGEASLGFYAAIAYPMVIGTTVVTAMTQAVIPRLANYCVNKFSHYRQLIRKLLMIGVIMGLFFVGGVLVFGKLVLSILYTAEYASYNVEFTLLAIGTAVSFISSFYGCGLTAARLFKTAMVIKILTCAVTVLTAFWLIPSYGIRGASILYIVVFSASLVFAYTAMLFYTRKRRSQEEKGWIDISTKGD